jgi:hypothetical protein
VVTQERLIACGVGAPGAAASTSLNHSQRRTTSATIDTPEHGVGVRLGGWWRSLVGLEAAHAHCCSMNSTTSTTLLDAPLRVAARPRAPRRARQQQAGLPQGRLPRVLTQAKAQPQLDENAFLQIFAAEIAASYERHERDGEKGLGLPQGAGGSRLVSVPNGPGHHDVALWSLGGARSTAWLSQKRWSTQNSLLGTEGTVSARL